MKKEKKNKRIEKVSKTSKPKKAAKKISAKTATIGLKSVYSAKLKPAIKLKPANKSVDVTPKVEVKKTRGAQIQKNSQYNTVMNHLITHGSINTVEAVTQYSVYRLGAVIFDLRQGGMDIKTSVHTFDNKNGRKSNVANYILQS
jgi:hypothetical protein